MVCLALATLTVVRTPNLPESRPGPLTLSRHLVAADTGLCNVIRVDLDPPEGLGDAPAM